MATKHETPGSTGHSEEKKQKIEAHKKSIDVSSSGSKKGSSKSKNIQKTGTGNDDWNDPTGNSHISRRKG